MTKIRAKRGFFGWIFLIIFLGFNALMALFLFRYWSHLGGVLSSGSEAGRAGAAIGVTIVSGTIFFFWAAGAVITGLLALLTRGRTTYIEETASALPRQSVGNIRLKRFVGVSVIIGGIVLLVLAATDTLTVPTKTATEGSPSTPASQTAQDTSKSSTASIQSSATVLLATEQEKRTAAKSWKLQEERSKIDDSVNVIAHIESIEPISDKFGRQRPMEIMVTCRESKTEFFIIFAGHFMSSHGDSGLVTYRIDAKPARNLRFTESTDHKAFGLSGGNSIPFIKDLFGAKKLLIRAVPFSESPVTAEFDISGSDEALMPVRKACAWAKQAAAKPVAAEAAAKPVAAEAAAKPVAAEAAATQAATPPRRREPR